MTATVRTIRSPVSAPASVLMPEAGGLRVRRAGTGRGRLVLFAHPATGTSAAFTPILDACAEAGLRAAAFDRRGFGCSPDMADDAPDQGSDVLAVVDELAPKGRVDLVGVGQGGHALLDFALANPQRVGHVVLTGCLPVGDDPMLQAATMQLSALQFDQRPPADREFSAGFAERDPDRFAQWQRDNQRIPSPDSPVQPLGVAPDFPRLAGLRRPMLLLAGVADLVLPPVFLSAVAARLGGVEFDLIPGAGHSVHVEQPDAFAERVIAFLKAR